MSSARDEILGKIARAAGRSPDAEKAARAAARQRVSAPVRHLVPGRVAGKSAGELRALLVSHLEGQSAEVVSVPSMADVPLGLARQFVASAARPLQLRIGSDPVLSGMPWGTVPNMTVASGPARPHDPIGVSHAAAGIAETGSLVLLSGAANPVTLAFLPETHVVVLEVGCIVGSYEDAVALVRESTAGTGLPRTINLISGPSRTADIGGILVMGAHGPRRLVVVLVGG